MSEELFEASRRLRDAAKTDFRDLPGGSVSGYLNTLTPATRFALAREYKAAEYLHETGGRIDHNGQLKPFVKRLDEAEQAKGQPKELRATITKLATEQLSQDLSDRMRTPSAADQVADSGPPSMRETMTAAFDIQEGAAP